MKKNPLFLLRMILFFVVANYIAKVVGVTVYQHYNDLELGMLAGLTVLIIFMVVGFKFKHIIGGK